MAASVMNFTMALDASAPQDTRERPVSKVNNETPTNYYLKKV